MKSVLLFLLFSLTSFSISGQSLEQSANMNKVYKNTIITSAGLLLFLDKYTSITFQYERILAAGKEGLDFGVSLGGGVLYDGQYRYNLIYPRVYWLIGKKSSKAELAVGGGLLLDLADEQGAVFPAIVIGYRYQKPCQRFLFRVGVALPEGIYAGIGYRF